MCGKAGENVNHMLSKWDRSGLKVVPAQARGGNGKW